MNFISSKTRLLEKVWGHNSDAGHLESFRNDDLLFDLIQAGLVEKVDSND
jgi:hypothetical protein